MIWLWNRSILGIPGEGYSRNASCTLNLISTFLLLSLVDTSAGGLLVLEGIIRPVVSVSITGWIPLLVDY